MIYPWQHEIFQQVWLARQQNRLAHALLFTGVSGIGKYAFAEYLVQALLCEQVGVNGEPCGTCHSCHLVLGHAHPDYLLISPEQVGHAIKVDQVRAVSDFCHQSSARGVYRLVLIHPAHQMNASAANAILKTLEEPASGAIIILLSDQYGRLPATIKSRCQRVIFPTPTIEQALPWLQENVETSLNHQQLLKIAEGSPLLAANLAEKGSEQLAVRQSLFDGLVAIAISSRNPVAIAAALPDDELLTLLAYFNSWLIDLLRLQLVNGAEVINDDYAAQLNELSVISTAPSYIKLLNEIQRTRQQINSGINFNKPLLLERLLIHWQESIACS